MNDAGNHAMQRSRACEVSQVECQLSRPADRQRYPTRLCVALLDLLFGASVRFHLLRP